MTTQDLPESPTAAAPQVLPAYPRQTEPGYYGPKRYGPNGFAVTAFWVGLAGGVPLSVLLACIALGKIRDTGQSGRGFAIAALVLSALWLPLYVLLLMHRAAAS